MRIQVDCRDADAPRAFYLGTQRLQISRVLERIVEESIRRFKVRVQDGRVFTLSQHIASSEWQLTRVGSFPRTVATLSSLRITGASRRCS